MLFDFLFKEKDPIFPIGTNSPIDSPEGYEELKKAIDILEKNGFKPFIHIAQGTMFGYICCNMDERERVNNLLRPVGAIISAEQLSPSMRRLITGRR